LYSVKHIPLASFQKDAAKWKVSTDIAVTVPFDLVKESVVGHAGCQLVHVLIFYPVKRWYREFFDGISALEK